MFKTKIKKIVIKSLLCLVLLMAFSAGLGVKAVYAAPPIECPKIGDATGTSVETNQCKYAGDKCPEGWNQVKPPEGGNITCKQISKGGSLSSEEFKNKITTLLWIQSALNKLLWPILVLIGGLMDNDLLFGHGMEERLREIWIIIRNLVNILFVIVLVGIALYNILGLGDDSGNYSIKSILPKIVIALIAINFSFLAIKVLLDGVNVLTVSIFSLPDQVNEGLSQILPGEDGTLSPESTAKVAKLCKLMNGLTVQEADSMTNEQIIKEGKDAMKLLIAKKYTLTATEPSAIDTEVAGKGEAFKAKFAAELQNAEEGKICNGLELSVQGEIFLKKYSSRNAAFAMALNMGKVIFYEDVAIKSAKDFERLATNALFSMVFYLVFAASFLALFVVLLARLVVMWLSIALSPLLLLAMAEPTLKEKLGGFNKLAEQFTKMALAPIIIALSMSIGWIMLKAIQGINSFNKTSPLFAGSDLGVPIAGLSTIQDLVVAMGCIGVVWMGVFSAAEGTFAEKAVGFIKDSVQKAATWVGTLPLKHTPFLPIQVPGAPEGQKYSLAEAQYAMKEAFDTSSAPASKLWEDITGKSPITHRTALDTERVKGKPEFYQWLKSSKDKLTQDDYRSVLSNFKTDRSDIWKTLPTPVQDLIQKIGDEGKEEDVKALFKIPEIAKASLLPEKRSDRAGTTPADTGPTPPTPVTADTAFGANKTLVKDKGLKEADVSMKVYNDARDSLSKNLDGWMSSNKDGKLSSTDKIKLEGTLIAQLQLGGEKPTPDDLKAQLHDDRYKYLTLALGDGNAATGEAKLTTLLAPAPGTAPAAPTAGTAGAAGAAPAAQPADEPAGPPAAP